MVKQLVIALSCFCLLVSGNVWGDENQALQLEMQLSIDQANAEYRDALQWYENNKPDDVDGIAEVNAFLDCNYQAGHVVSQRPRKGDQTDDNENPIPNAYKFYMHFTMVSNSCPTKLARGRGIVQDGKSYCGLDYKGRNYCYVDTNVDDCDARCS